MDILIRINEIIVNGTNMKISAWVNGVGLGGGNFPIEVLVPTTGSVSTLNAALRDAAVARLAEDGYTVTQQDNKVIWPAVTV